MLSTEEMNNEKILRENTNPNHPKFWVYVENKNQWK